VFESRLNDQKSRVREGRGFTVSSCPPVGERRKKSVEADSAQGYVVYFQVVPDLLCPVKLALAPWTQPVQAIATLWAVAPHRFCSVEVSVRVVVKQRTSK
jgi:hypothetical protein